MRVASVVLAVVLCGCAQSAAPPADDPLLDAEVGQEVGAISGVVVTPTVMPIANATVTLVGGDAQASTDDQGRFVFERLEPGFYVLRAEAPGHFAIQTSTDVAAGEVSKVRMLLPVDSTPVPYPLTTRFDGWMEAADAWATWLLMDFTGNTELCKCEFNASVGPGADTAVLEAFWEPGSAVNDPEMWIEIYPPGGDDDGQYFESPVHWTRPATEWEEGDARIVFSVGTTLAVQQSFEVFFTVWYNGPPPEGWSVAN